MSVRWAKVGVMVPMLLLGVACGAPAATPPARSVSGSVPSSKATTTQRTPTPVPATHTPTPSPTPTTKPPDRSVAHLLRNRPPRGATVEIDAYFSGGAENFSLTTSQPGHIWCPPIPWSTALTDRPFPGALSVLNMGRNNYLPAGTPYLVAMAPEALRPNVDVLPQLPFHARLRGHLDDPAVAQCSEPDRIFVVEQVVTVYDKEPPPGFLQPGRPADYTAWKRHHDAALGYSVAHPPAWKVEPVSDSRFLTTVALRSAQWPCYPVIMRVRPRETPITGYIPADSPPLTGQEGMSPYVQSVQFGEIKQDSQQLKGYSMDRAVGATEREVTTLFNAHGRTYELTLRYPIGFALPQPLLAIYSGMVEEFRLDTPPSQQ